MIQIHPVAEIFPRILGEDFLALKADIKKNGLIEAIWTYQGAIIEGRNRYYACTDIGIEPRYREYTGDDPLSFSISLNLTRRHLTDGQRQMVGAAIANIVHEQRKEETTMGASQEKASNLLNTSVRGIQRAKGILHEGAPELIEAVKSGLVSVSAASVVATLPKEEQQQIVASGEVAKTAKRIRVEKSRKPISLESATHEKIDSIATEKSAQLTNLTAIRNEIEQLRLLVTRLNKDDFETGIASLHQQIDRLSLTVNQQTMNTY